MNAEVIKIVRHFARENKSIAAVCHGAQLLAAAGVIAGKRVSAFPACAPEVTLAEAEYAQIALDQAITPLRTRFLSLLRHGPRTRHGWHNSS
jgi:protease I